MIRQPLETLTATVGELSAVIAHEVRNPLGIIKNAVFGLRRTDLPRDGRETLLRILDEEVNRLNRLTYDLLAYTQPVAAEYRSAGLQELMRSAVDQGCLASHGKTVDIDMDLGGGPARVRGDPDLLRHAFVNVVEHALHARADSSPLVIRAEPSAIPRSESELSEAVAVNFSYRPRSTHSRSRPRPGARLALAVVDRVLRAHGGSVSIASDAHSNTAIILIVPAQSRFATSQPASARGLGEVVAHEVRNPLAIMKNAVSGLRRAIPQADQARLLGILDEEADRLNRLVGDLLAYSQSVEPDAQELEIHTLVSQALKEGCGNHEEVTATVSLTQRSRSVIGDPQLLQQSLRNLVTNACQAMNHRGTLTVSVKDTALEDSPAVQIEIRDEGCGMTASVLEQATEPFFTTRATGTGLGLAIVRRVIEAHRGTFELHSTEGQGAAAVVKIPIRRTQEKLDSTRPSPRRTA